MNIRINSIIASLIVALTCTVSSSMHSMHTGQQAPRDYRAEVDALRETMRKLTIQREQETAEMRSQSLDVQIIRPRYINVEEAVTIFEEEWFDRLRKQEMDSIDLKAIDAERIEKRQQIIDKYAHEQNVLRDNYDADYLKLLESRPNNNDLAAIRQTDDYQTMNSTFENAKKRLVEECDDALENVDLQTPEPHLRYKQISIFSPQLHHDIDPQFIVNHLDRILEAMRLSQKEWETGSPSAECRKKVMMLRSPNNGRHDECAIYRKKREEVLREKIAALLNKKPLLVHDIPTPSESNTGSTRSFQPFLLRTEQGASKKARH